MYVWCIIRWSKHKINISKHGRIYIRISFGLFCLYSNNFDLIFYKKKNMFSFSLVLLSYSHSFSIFVTQFMFNANRFEIIFNESTITQHTQTRQVSSVHHCSKHESKCEKLWISFFLHLRWLILFRIFSKRRYWRNDTHTEKIYFRLAPK